MSTHKPHHLISLGSSFAAGPGIPPLSLRSAGRSSKNYASLLSQHFSFQHTDLTVSGATLSNITSAPQEFFGTTFAPQITAVTEDADIITITAGGNDLQYVGGLTTEELLSTWAGRLFNLFRTRSQPAEAISIDELAENFINVLDAVHAKAPKAKIYLVAYLTLLSPATESGIHVSLSAEAIKKYQQIAEDLLNAYKLASQARSEWCSLVDVAELSKEHGILTDEPWVEGLSIGSIWGGNPMHPNEKGMRAVADMLIERLESDGFVAI
ncbi:uncharacterized protein RCO7_06501 [Rhynchosporium graminicola]|uniref:SGNH hydrolase-type esterase domain-containing protein n=1 Tax=Rhynchosporium graminicola TaxID=2792576 RepID=A0A1E1KA89_9HELO|nr:uncharacterized protein RCO7_06501 [Rhynchosporium commune]